MMGCYIRTKFLTLVSFCKLASTQSKNESFSKSRCREGRVGPIHMCRKVLWAAADVQNTRHLLFGFFMFLVCCQIGLRGIGKVVCVIKKKMVPNTLPKRLTFRASPKTVKEVRFNLPTS